MFPSSVPWLNPLLHEYSNCRSSVHSDALALTDRSSKCFPLLDVSFQHADDRLSTRSSLICHPEWENHRASSHQRHVLSPPLSLRLLPVWCFCSETILQKTNLLVDSQKNPLCFVFLPLFVTKRFVSGLFCVDMCAWIFSQGNQKKMEWSNWLPVCPVSFNRPAVWSNRDSVWGPSTKQLWHLSRYMPANLLSSAQTKRFSF